MLRLYLGHVDQPDSQRFVAQNGPVLVALPPLQHNLQLIGISLQEVGVLQGKTTGCGHEKGGETKVVHQN